MHRKEYGGSVIFKSIQGVFLWDGMGDSTMFVERCFVEHVCRMLSDML